jgi:hypothetical protein
VHVNETRRDDQASRIENLPTIAVSDVSRGSNFDDTLAVEKNIARRIRLGCGVEDATVFNQKHEWIP